MVAPATELGTLETSGELSVTAPPSALGRWRFITYHKWDRMLICTYAGTNLLLAGALGYH